MTTHEALVAARDRARRDLEHLLRTAAAEPRTDEQITQAAEKYLADLRENGFMHRAELHAAPEPAGPKADAARTAEILAHMQDELAQIRERHKTEDRRRETQEHHDG